MNFGRTQSITEYNLKLTAIEHLLKETEHTSLLFFLEPSEIKLVKYKRGYSIISVNMRCINTIWEILANWWTIWSGRNALSDEIQQREQPHEYVPRVCKEIKTSLPLGTWMILWAQRQIWQKAGIRRKIEFIKGLGTHRIYHSVPQPA